MTEDLVSMALAEATSNPVLASWSLTVLIVFFNLARGLIFSGRWTDVEEHAAPDSSAVGAEKAFTAEESNFNAPSEERDYVALASALVNILVGSVIGHVVAGKLSLKAAFCAVAVQMMVQLLVVPIVLRHTGGLLVRLMHRAEQSVEERHASEPSQQEATKEPTSRPEGAGKPPVHEGQERIHDSWPLGAVEAGMQGVVSPAPASQVPCDDGLVKENPTIDALVKTAKLPVQQQPRGRDVVPFKGNQLIDDSHGKLPQTQNLTNERVKEKRRNGGNVVNIAPESNATEPELLALQQQYVASVGQSPTICDMPRAAQAGDKCLSPTKRDLRRTPSKTGGCSLLERGCCTPGRGSKWTTVDAKWSKAQL
jgi:hypothetical protein